MKYTILFIALLAVYWGYKFISAVVENGFPTHPAYYISSVVAILINLFTFRLFTAQLFKRRYILIPLAVLCISIALNISRQELLMQIGTGLIFWYVMSAAIFGLYFHTKKLLSKTELTEAEENQEYTYRGMLLYLLILAAIFAPLIIIAFVLSSVF